MVLANLVWVLSRPVFTLLGPASTPGGTSRHRGWTLYSIALL